eukprot:4802123-Pyramimonas_sp.AAC.1
MGEQKVSVLVVAQRLGLAVVVCLLRGVIAVVPFPCFVGVFRCCDLHCCPWRLALRCSVRVS